MIRFFLASLLMLLPFHAAFSCDAARTQALLSRVSLIEESGPVIQERTPDGRAVPLSFHSAAGDLDETGQPASRRACHGAAARRLMTGLDDQSSHVACVSRPAPQGGIQTDLKTISLEIADEVCNQMNVCLYELYDHPESDSYRRIASQWDSFGCHGH